MTALWLHENIPGATVHVYRQAFLQWEGEFFSAYLGDTFTKDRLTVNAGLRFDHQKSENLGATVPSSPILPEQLPGGFPQAFRQQRLRLAGKAVHKEAEQEDEMTHG